MSRQRAGGSSPRSRPSRCRSRSRSLRSVPVSVGQRPFQSRWSLLDEGRHALALVVGREEQEERAPLVSRPATSGSSSARRIACFAASTATGGCAAIRPASSSAAASVSSAGTTSADEAVASASRGADRPAGEDQLHRPGLADRPRQPLGPAGAGHDAELDLGLAELGVLAGDDQVAAHRQLAAAAEREAADRGDQRRPDRARSAPRRANRSSTVSVDRRLAWPARGCRRRPRSPRRRRR